MLPIAGKRIFLNSGGENCMLLNIIFAEGEQNQRLQQYQGIVLHAKREDFPAGDRPENYVLTRSTTVLRRHWLHASQACPGKSMAHGYHARTKWGRSIFLVLIPLALLTTEIHGILGHHHGERAYLDRHIEQRSAQSGFRFAGPGDDQDDPFCSICLSYKLLRHSEIPETPLIAESPCVTLAIAIQRTSLVQIEPPRTENRSPPLA
jgi:hypothetical protein